MNTNEVTIGQAKEIAAMFNTDPPNTIGYSNGMVGKYVIVRCKNAGVHAGILESHHNRECVLSESRRLWYWKAKRSSFLSGVAKYGIDETSKVGAPIRIHLTESCEIIECTIDAAKSIKEAREHEQN